MNLTNEQMHSIRQFTAGGLLTLLMACVGCVTTPHLVEHGTSRQLIVDGKPFLVLGGELHNSSASSAAAMKPVWPRLAQMHLNTVILPVSWELLEPSEGQFDFKLVDDLLAGAKENHLHLVLLWFGSWKNGLSSYQPLWVKRDSKRFPPAENADGKALDILSTFGEETMKADAHAFAALMQHLRDTDRARTVLMVQVENEVGMREASRDHSSAANAAFDGPVPAALLNLCIAGKALPELNARWIAAGRKTGGSWPDVFGTGDKTDELFMAWHYAAYLEQVAAAGKKAYPIPMYANAWLDQPGTPKPGDYPSGGPLPPLFNVWQTAAPSLDFLAPDLYVPEFEARCVRYTQLHNPLFIPETNTGDRAGANALLAFGKFSAIGFSPFGIDGSASGFGVDPKNFPEIQSPPETQLSQAYAALDRIKPLLLDAQGTEKITGVMLGPGAEDESAQQQTIQLGGYTLACKPRQFRRRPASEPATANTQTVSGLFIATRPDEFVLVTTGLDVTFTKNNAAGTTAVASIDEGEFVDGKWVSGKRLNGDETDHNRAAARAMQPFRVLRIRLFQRP